MDIIKGRVWKFGDDLNTDVIAPGRYMNGPLEEMKKHVLEVVNHRFSLEVKQGDIIVGGNNFGCGSSREEAPTVLKASGITAIVAESFARIFFRNAVAIGLPVVSCPGIAGIFKEGDILELDLDAVTITNVNTGTELSSEPLSGEIKEILSRGGIMAVLKEIAASQNGS